MIKRSTWILLIVLGLVICVYLLINRLSPAASEIIPTATLNPFLVNKSDGSLQSLLIYDREGNTFQMQKDLSKVWVITAPTPGVADQILAGSVETQVGAIQIVTLLETPPPPDVTGLVFPSQTVEMGFENGVKHKIEIGILTPTNSGYYARIDENKTLVVSQSGIDAILKQLAQPPYPATETPDPIVESSSTLVP